MAKSKKQPEEETMAPTETAKRVRKATEYIRISLVRVGIDGEVEAHKPEYLHTDADVDNMLGPDSATTPPNFTGLVNWLANDAGREDRLKKQKIAARIAELEIEKAKLEKEG
jgi:hypothetical protein